MSQDCAANHANTLQPAGLEPARGASPPILPGQLAVVVGGGASGTAAARLLLALGARVRVAERDRDGISPALRGLARDEALEIVTGPHAAAQFSGASLVVTSPGVPLHALAESLREAGDPPLIAEMELALCYVREPILAVTGTSGKTTTVSLAAAMLEAAGKRIFLGGNIGTPLSEYVLAAREPEARAEVLVLEMSSFQLQGSEHLAPRVAVLLNLSPNHLDHHKDMAEYVEAKFRIFAGQSADDLALLPDEPGVEKEDQPAPLAAPHAGPLTGALAKPLTGPLVDQFRKLGGKARLSTFGPTNRFPDSRLLGKHNAANAEAAYLACREFGVDEATAARAVAGFAPLRHRLEPAATVDGVLYVNDSKSTTVESLRVALESFDAPIVLLAGGKFKGGDLASLRDLLRRRVKAVALFGASREIFEPAWQGAVPLSWDPDLPAALARVRSLAAAGDVVLLSPATSSFDLYENYKARGDHFCDLARDTGAISKNGDLA